MSNPLHIIGIGELLWDVLPEGKKLGGAPCNFVYHAQNMGARALVLSAIGNDQNGKEMLTELKAKNISTELIQVNNKSTGTVDVRLNNQGEPSYIIHEDVAWDNIHFNHTIEEKIKEADIICFGSLAQRKSTSRNTILEILQRCYPEKIVVFDVNLRQQYYNREVIEKSLQLCNVLKLNEEELPVICELLGITIDDGSEQINKLIEIYDLDLVAFTKGGEESFLVTRTETSYLQSKKVKVKDTVGAGDSFTAAMVVGFANGDSLRDIHQKAVELSAYVCTQNGAMPEYNH